MSVTFRYSNECRPASKTGGIVSALRRHSREACPGLRAGAGAIAVTKASFLAANQLTLNARDMAMLAHESWTQRNSGEGREGTAAFREKRRPAWYVPPLPREA